MVNSEQVQKVIDESMVGIDKAFAKFNMPETEENSFNSTIIDVSDIDITKPYKNSLLGLICDNMKAQASRLLPLSYPLYGLQLLSLVAGNNRGFDGSKLNLFTIMISETGSGKDLGQAFCATVANQLFLSKFIFDKPRSDKDMITNLIDGDGKSLYIVDECQGLFRGLENSNAQHYISGIGDELLKMSTARVYTLSGLHKREFTERGVKELNFVNRLIEKEVDDIKRIRLERKAQKIERSLNCIENGFTGINVSFAGTSTPKNLDSLICEQNLESGLLARAIIFRNDDGRQPLSDNSSHNIKPEIFERLKSIKDSENVPVNADEDAKFFLDYVRSYYDQEVYRNNERTGPLYARIFERVKVLSSLLALESGMIKLDDCRYALAICLRSIADCEFLAIQSLSKESTFLNPENFTEEITARVLRFTKGADNGLYASKLKQRVSKSFKNPRQKAMFDNLYNNVIQGLEIMGKIQINGKKINHTGAF